MSDSAVIGVPKLAGSRSLLVKRLSAVMLVGLFMLPLLGHAYNFKRYGRLIRLTDEYMYYTHARSWYFDGDCEYANDMLLAPGFENAAMYAAHKTATGYTHNHFNCGTALVSLPFLVLADGVTAVHNLLAASPLPRDGYSTYYQFFVPLGHLLLGVFGLYAAYLVAARYFPPLIALAATHVVLLGTNAFYYIVLESTHSHAASIGWIGLMIYLSDTIWLRGFTWRRCALLGLVCGMMVVTRPQDLFWGVIPVLLLLGKATREFLRSESWQRLAGLALLTIAAAAVCYIPQAIVNQHLFGELVHNTYEDVVVNDRPQVLAWTDPHLTRAILYPTTGLLWTTPMALLCMIGSACLVFRRELSLRSIGLAFLSVYYLVACVWWVFTGYGHRYLSSCIVAYIFGTCLLMMWASKSRWRAVTLTVLLALGVAWQGGLLVAVDRGWWEVGQASPLYTLFFDAPANLREPWI